MFLILRFRVVMGCGAAPQTWRSAAQSILGLEGRRIWESQCGVSWGSGSGGWWKGRMLPCSPQLLCSPGNCAVCCFSSSAAVFCTLCIQPSPVLFLDWGNWGLLSPLLLHLLRTAFRRPCLLFAICPVHCALVKKGACAHAITDPCKTQFVLCSHSISCMVSFTSPTSTLFS